MAEQSEVKSSPDGKAVFGDEEVTFPQLVLGTAHGSLHYSNTCIAEEMGAEEKCVVQLEIGDLVKKPFKDKSLNELFEKPANQISLLSARPVGAAPLPASAKSIGINGCNGRHQLTVSEYASCIKIHSPNVAIAMADEVAWHMNCKRIRTAVERTLAWFGELRNLLAAPSVKLFGVVVGGPFCPEELIEKQVKTYIEGGVVGLVVGGVGQGECIEDRKRLIRLFRKFVGSKVPILVQGADTLMEIFHTIFIGADLISSDYPRTLSCAGLVLAYDFMVFNGGDAPPPEKRQKLMPISLDQVPIINLWDPKYSKDKTPLLPGCTCHCCRLYSKAYIHHLLLSHELLADSMVYVHNRHLLNRIFKAVKARSLSESNGFEKWMGDFLSCN